MKYKIKLFDPFIDKSEEKSIIKVLQSKFWASGGGTNNVHKLSRTFRYPPPLYIY